ncbi:restriction endonuclease [Stenotrophomonas tumulicola]|uniref:Restriction endonuclease n=1 Tax=Stenotrophomonas tumulicola TaxID=1685415 RepID=A0A7W3FJJ1_9GAMM|nr:restriction endonuclease [Stenotrophomonas tumulicola]MBA8680698.1 restriction endonuclease [Stenotrophomonas tumulicola]
MFSWILALLLALACFLLATAYLWLVTRRRKQMTLGLQALASMHWREFSELVKRALHEQRGLQEQQHSDEDSRASCSDFPMGNDAGQWLVSCKHGLAYRIGTAAINELGAAARLSGAHGGILITEGRVDAEGLVVAGKQAVEVLDGRRLWPMLSPYLPGDIESRVHSAARRHARQRIVVAALASCTLGLLAGMGYQTAQVAEPQPAVVVAVATAAPVAPAPERAGETVPTPANVAGSQQADPDAATLERYQQEVSRALGRIPGVASGIWQTRQTLAVDRTGEIDSLWPDICEVVTAYPALRTVRVQLNARPGVDEPVRWRQCATL